MKGVTCPGHFLLRSQHEETAEPQSIRDAERGKQNYTFLLLWGWSGPRPPLVREQRLYIAPPRLAHSRKKQDRLRPAARHGQRAPFLPTDRCLPRLIRGGRSGDCSCRTIPEVVSSLLTWLCCKEISFTRRTTTLFSGFSSISERHPRPKRNVLASWIGSLRLEAPPSN